MPTIGARAEVEFWAFLGGWSTYGFEKVCTSRKKEWTSFPLPSRPPMVPTVPTPTAAKGKNPALLVAV